MDRAMLALELDESMRDQAVERGERRFFPNQFAALASEHDVIDAMLDMERGGKLACHVTLFCPEGHRYWSGLRSALPTPRPVCRTCGAAFDEDAEAEIYFALSPSWEAMLEKKKQQP